MERIRTRNWKIVFVTAVLMLIIGTALSAETITVMAAASMKGAFEEIKKNYENEKGVKIEIRYAGSQILRTQIENGAQCDIFVSADTDNMIQLEKKGIVAVSDSYLKNSLIIAVWNGNKEVKDINGLTRKGVKLAVADNNVPVGKYTLEMISNVEKSGKFDKNFRKLVEENIVTKESDVKSVVAKIELGEADAGIVYRTDITAKNREKIRMIEIDDRYNVIGEYKKGIIKGSEGKKDVIDFYNYLSGERSRGILKGYNFIIP